MLIITPLTERFPIDAFRDEYKYDSSSVTSTGSASGHTVEKRKSIITGC